MYLYIFTVFNLNILFFYKVIIVLKSLVIFGNNFYCIIKEKNVHFFELLSNVEYILQFLQLY